jgi:hypothetical protein
MDRTVTKSHDTPRRTTMKNDPKTDEKWAHPEFGDSP